MNQLIIFILNGLFIGICEKIDTAFGNNISLDAICVLSAYTIITWVSYCVYQIGSYSYRILLSKEKNCFLLTLLASIIWGSIIILLSDKVPYLYKLTDIQYTLFTKCLIIHGYSIPLMGIGDYLYNYILMKCKNKLMWISNIIFYITMILFDTVVCSLGYDLDALIFATGAAYVLYDLILLIFSNIFKSDDKIRLTDIKICFKHGANVLIDRLLGKVATVIYNIYASKLDTEMYAVHSICYSIAVFTENITNQQFNYQVLILSTIDKTKDKWNKCINILKKTFLPLGLIGYIFSFILLLIIHGDVNIKDCIIPLILYCTQVFLIQLYESLRGYLTSLHRSDVLKWAGLVGIFIRIPITLISYYSGIGIYLFALASSVDFICRGIYFYISSRNIIKMRE